MAPKKKAKAKAPPESSVDEPVASTYSVSQEVEINNLVVPSEDTDVMVSEWTVEEDSFVVRHFKVKKTALKKMEALYAAAMTKNPETFTKGALSLDDLRVRFDELQTEQYASRYKMLLALVTAQCSHEDKEKREKEKTPAAKPKKEEESGKGGKAGAKGKDKGVVVVEEEDPNASEEMDMVVIDQTGRNRSLSVKKNALKTHSSVLAALIEHAPPPKPGGVPTFTVDANSIAFEEGRSYDVITHQIFQRVAQICEAPQCVERTIESEEQLAVLHKDIAALQEESLTQLGRRRDEWLEYAATKYAEKEESLRQQNESDFQHYIRSVKNRFARRLKDALDETSKRLSALQDDIQLFFATQEAKMKEMVEGYVVMEGKVLREQLEQSKAVTDKAFADGVAMKLAVAGHLLQCQAVNDACIAVVKKNPKDFMSCREWQCDLIRDRYSREVLSAMSITDILELQALNPPHSYMSKVHIDADIAARRKIALEELREMPNADFQNLLDEGGHAFPDLVERERVERGEARGSGALDPSLMTTHAKLTEHNTCAQVVHPQRQVTVLGVLERVSGKWGRHYFEVTIDELDELSSCSVGWDPKRESVNPMPVPGLVEGPEGNFGAALQNDGLLLSNGCAEFVGARFSQGAVLGCGIDLASNTLLFTLNGVKVTLPQGDVALKPPYRLVPAASLFAAKLSSRCQVTFNFNGPFIHEEFTKSGGWEPIGDPSNRL